MAKSAHGRSQKRRLALVVLGWLVHAAALTTWNPILKCLLLVAFRALPHVLTAAVTSDGKLQAQSWHPQSAAGLAGAASLTDTGHSPGFPCYHFATVSARKRTPNGRTRLPQTRTRPRPKPLARLVLCCRDITSGIGASRVISL
jgi:hypothetical protein